MSNTKKLPYPTNDELFFVAQSYHQCFFPFLFSSYTKNVINFPFIPIFSSNSFSLFSFFLFSLFSVRLIFYLIRAFDAVLVRDRKTPSPPMPHRFAIRHPPPLQLQPQSQSSLCTRTPTHAQVNKMLYISRPYSEKVLYSIVTSNFPVIIQFLMCCSGRRRWAKRYDI